MSASAVRWMHSNAAAIGDAQEDAQNCLGGIRSGTPVVCLEAQRDMPMTGIQIRYIAGANGPGIGTLRAASANSLTWTPPGGDAGAAVTLTQNVPAILYGDDENQWIEVERISAANLSGSETVLLVDCYDGAVGFGEVATADAVAGEDYYDALFPYIAEDVSVTNLTIWLDAATTGYEVAEEASVSSAIQSIADQNTAPTGVSWNSGTSSGAGINLGNFTLGQDIGVWFHRAISAYASGAAGILVLIHYQFTVGATTYAGVLRNRYHIERTDEAGIGMWVGEDAAPDWEGAYEEFFTEADLDYETTFTASPSHTYYIGFRARNAYGLWETNFETQAFIIDADGALASTPPSAPQDLSVVASEAGRVSITGRYYPVPDGRNRASTFAIWYGTSSPTPSHPATAYREMARQSGIEVFALSAGPQFSGTTYYAVAKALRFVQVATRCQSAGTQLPASGAGSIGGVFDDWAAAGTVERKTLVGQVIERFSYSSRTDTLLTVGAGGRALYGTDASASAVGDLLVPVDVVESAASAEANGDTIWQHANVPLVHAILDSQYAVLQTPATGPNETQVIDAGENVYWELTPGNLWFWLDSVLGCRIILDTRNSRSGVYFPNDVWALDKTVEVSGAAPGVTIDVVSASDVYWVVNGVRRLRFNMGANAIQFYGSETGPDAEIPAVFGQSTTWSRAAETLVNVWNPHRARYEPALSLKNTGALHTKLVLDNMTYSQAQLVAL
jgi:hypothetical protein